LVLLFFLQTQHFILGLAFAETHLAGKKIEVKSAAW
jgi:hypothetical protein